MATKKKQVMIRMRPSNYEKLKAIAERNRRTVTNQVEYVIEIFVENYEAQYGQVKTTESSSDAASSVSNHQLGNGNLFVNAN